MANITINNAELYDFTVPNNSQNSCENPYSIRIGSTIINMSKCVANLENAVKNDEFCQEFARDWHFYKLR